MMDADWIGKRLGVFAIHDGSPVAVLKRELFTVSCCWSLFGGILSHLIVPPAAGMHSNFGYIFLYLALVVWRFYGADLRWLALCYLLSVHVFSVPAAMVDGGIRLYLVTFTVQTPMLSYVLYGHQLALFNAAAVAGSMILLKTQSVVVGEPILHHDIQQWKTLETVALVVHLIHVVMLFYYHYKIQTALNTGIAPQDLQERPIARDAAAAAPAAAPGADANANNNAPAAVVGAPGNRYQALPVVHRRAAAVRNQMVGVGAPVVVPRTNAAAPDPLDQSSSLPQPSLANSFGSAAVDAPNGSPTSAPAAQMTGAPVITSIALRPSPPTSDILVTAHGSSSENAASSVAAPMTPPSSDISPPPTETPLSTGVSPAPVTPPGSVSVTPITTTTTAAAAVPATSEPPSTISFAKIQPQARTNAIPVPGNLHNALTHPAAAIGASSPHSSPVSRNERMHISNTLPDHSPQYGTAQSAIGVTQRVVTKSGGTDSLE